MEEHDKWTCDVHSSFSRSPLGVYTQRILLYDDEIAAFMETPPPVVPRNVYWNCCSSSGVISATKASWLCSLLVCFLTHTKDTRDRRTLLSVFSQLL